MTISADDVRRIAALAELDVPEEDVAVLAAQLGRIVAHVAGLPVVEGGTGGAGFLPGPAAAPLRPDEVRPAPLARPVSAIGPDVRDGFFVVPRLPAMDRE